MRTQDYVKLRDKQMEEMGLADVYSIARKKPFEHMREWGVL